VVSLDLKLHMCIKNKVMNIVLSYMRCIAYMGGLVTYIFHSFLILYVPLSQKYYIVRHEIKVHFDLNNPNVY